MKKHLLAAGALLALATPASAQNLFNPGQPLFPNFFGATDEPQTTRQFRAEALRSDAFAIESSRVALERSRNPRVRAYARQTIQERTATTAALLPPDASLNATGNVVPTQQAGLFSNGVVSIVTAPFEVPVNLVGATFGGNGAADQNHRVVLDQRRLNMLGQLNQARSQRQFDAVYAGQQVNANQQTVALYADESQNGTLPEARTFASQALPAVQRGLDHSVRLDERVGYPAAPSF